MVDMVLYNRDIEELDLRENRMTAESGLKLYKAVRKGGRPFDYHTASSHMMD